MKYRALKEMMLHYGLKMPKQDDLTESQTMEGYMRQALTEHQDKLKSGKVTK